MKDMDNEYITDQYLEDQKNYIASEILIAMKNKGVTVNELAEAIGFKPSTVAKIVDGTFWPNLKQYIIILAALNLEAGKPVERGIKKIFQKNNFI